MLLNEGQGGLKIGIVECVWDTESKWSELSSLKENGMHEAESEHNGSPFVIWLDLLKEVLVDNSLEGSRHTSLDTLWWISGVLDSQLQETEREIVIWLTSDPESEIWMNFSLFWE